MKTIFVTLSCFYLLPVLLAAQPVISTNEYYHINDVIEMVKCDPSLLNAGAPGAGVTWNFSGLSASGGMYTMTVAADTSTVFITSNLLVKTSDGLTEYIQENSTDNYINGITDATGVTATYSSYDIAKRPVTYNTNYIDSYRVDAPSIIKVGGGRITQTGDAYGTLTLPTGTFSNVLRIRKYQVETDTVSGAASTTFTTSYLWFDTLHHAPLFRMDSVTSLAGSSQTAMYLSLQTGVANLNSGNAGYAGALHNSALLVTGDFEYGKAYEVTVYSIIGTKVFTTEFIAYGNSQRFDVGSSLYPGIYIIDVTQKSNPSDHSVIKVFNQ